MTDKPHVHELKANDFILEPPIVQHWRPLAEIAAAAGIEGAIVIRGNDNLERAAVAARGMIQYLEPLPVDFQATDWRRAVPKSPHP